MIRTKGSWGQGCISISLQNTLKFITDGFPSRPVSKSRFSTSGPPLGNVIIKDPLCSYQLRRGYTSPSSDPLRRRSANVPIIMPGAIYLTMGPSGAGKDTLLLGTFLPPSLPSFVPSLFFIFLHPSLSSFLPSFCLLFIPSFFPSSSFFLPSFIISVLSLLPSLLSGTGETCDGTNVGSGLCETTDYEGPDFGNTALYRPVWATCSLYLCI